MPLDREAADKGWYAWVDPLVKRRLLRTEAVPTAAAQETVQAAIALLDISGFTALAEDLAKAGPIGAERLKEQLDACFGRITTLVQEHGGLVVTFPGDGVLAVWLANDGDSLQDAALRAARCCLAATERVRDPAMSAGAPLRLRAGVAAGSMHAMCVGGVDGRWESLLTGEPVDHVGAAVQRARPGEVVVAAPAWGLIAKSAVGAALDGNSHRLERINDAATVPSPPDVRDEAVASAAASALRAYIPDAVLAYLDAGQIDWLAAFRPATVMFIGLKDLGRAGTDSLTTLHRVVACVQSVMAHYGGSLNQALVDDKGTVFVVGWGLAMHAHEDDAARAVEASLAIRAGLLDLGCASGIGLATGRIFTGIRGNQHRKEYAMIGDVVNLAARLMQEASDGIRCDDRTRASARQRVLFEKLPPVRVKGKADPIAVYRPLKKKAGGTSDLVGRSRELQYLLERLRTLESGAAAGTVVIEGEPGIGKSRLIAALLLHIQTSNVRSVIARGDPVERSSSYHAWRPVLTRLLGLDDHTASEAQRQRVLSLLESDPELSRHASLLNVVVPLGLEEREVTSRLTPQGRADMVRELMLRLFASMTRGMATLLVLEDAHWFDSASWAFADALARRVHPLLIVLTMRPVLRHEMTAECRRVLDRSDVARLALDTLAPDDAMVLASQCLGTDTLPLDVNDLIWRKAAGHPYFTEQLALALRDAAAIRIDHGECSLVGDLRTLDSLKLPETVQGVVMSRIDRLTPSQQIALKIASVIGPVFDSQTVYELLPGRVAPDVLQADFDTMVTLRLLSVEPGA